MPWAKKTIWHLLHSLVSNSKAKTSVAKVVSLGMDKPQGGIWWKWVLHNHSLTTCGPPLKVFVQNKQTTNVSFKVLHEQGRHTPHKLHHINAAVLLLFLRMPLSQKQSISILWSQAELKKKNNRPNEIQLFFLGCIYKAQ